MPKGVPGLASPIAARRHLLLHLNDVRRLRENPIVAPLFRGVPRNGHDERRVACEIRAAVERIVESMLHAARGTEAVGARRRYEIVVRCDLRGEAHKRTAAALDLSLRQFYRERALVSEIVGERIAQWVHRDRTASAHVVDAFALSLKQASILRFAGRCDDAAAVLERLARASDDAWKKIRLLSSLAESQAECGAYERAQAAIAGGECVLRANVRGGARRKLAAAASIELARASLLETQGMLERARIASERGEAIAAMGDDDPETSDILARTLVKTASYDIKSGDIAAARSRLDRAAAIAGALPRAEPDLLIEYFLRRGELCSLLPQADAGAIEAYNRAATLSEETGFAMGAINAIAIYASHLLLRGNTEEAAIQMRSALAIESLRGSYIYATVELIAAEVACIAGRPYEAMNYARSARASFYEGGCDWARSFGTEASAHLIAGRYDTALQAATTAVQTFRRVRSDRYGGSAMRTLAECYAALGRRKEARRCIADSLAMLQAHGHARSLERAYRTSAAITGNRRHADVARDIAPQFRTSP